MREKNYYFLPQTSTINVTQWLFILSLTIVIHLVLLTANLNSTTSNHKVKKAESLGIKIDLKTLSSYPVNSNPSTLNKSVHTNRKTIKNRETRTNQNDTRTQKNKRVKKPDNKEKKSLPPSTPKKYQVIEKIYSKEKSSNKKETPLSQPFQNNESKKNQDKLSTSLYEQTLINWLQRHKRYPNTAKKRGLQGNVTLQFTIDRTGNLLSYRIIELSNHKILNRAVEKMVKKSSPFPAVPQNMNPGQSSFIFTVPVTFKIST